MDQDRVADALFKIARAIKSVAAVMEECLPHHVTLQAIEKAIKGIPAQGGSGCQSCITNGKSMSKKINEVI